ncbi:hypothetical protein BpHYR1_029418 [Brachionus plicatilis]|uniref:Uncharacterized protein n=1 Tax=Brachionus plicatilis TaxID=10195 RepID=A0A3M7QA76_BRAPC|nr:hypothetical protein BpHYR1_029418 [Brachionus plicatilis]
MISHSLQSCLISIRQSY